MSKIARGRGRPAAAVKISRNPTRGQKLAKAIRHLRKAKGADVETLAKRAGVSASVWYRLERATVKNLRERTLSKVARVFRMGVERLEEAGTKLCQRKAKTAAASS